MNKYGLLGRNISYSFSKRYFTEKFQKEGIAAQYLNFDIPDLAAFSEILEANPDLKGLNVTIPYKESIIPYLDDLTPMAREIGAVNTIEFSSEGLIGHNTDYYGFKESIRPFLEAQHQHALILGTGGASKAVQYALETLNIKTLKVSRTKAHNQITYDEIDTDILKKYLVIVNCTPLGTHPDVLRIPPIPISQLNNYHMVYDLIYNPAETALMQQAAEKGAQVSNGYQMLLLQAEEAWKIWNS